jgi:two-component system, OmpR family, phosphate regulon sensor histidine kinase PhoR
LRIKNFRVAFRLSAILVGLLVVLISLLFFVIDLKPDIEILLLMASMLLFFFIFSVFLINYRIERFILNKIKSIYNDLSPSGVSMSQQIVQSDMEALRESVQKFADDKKLEIETLKEKEDYRKEFIGNISHELKTPLFTIQGYVLTLLEGAIGNKNVREKYLKRTAKGVERLIYVVKDLDLITQFESGIKTIDRSFFDIKQLIENVFDLLEMQAVKNKISINFAEDYPKSYHVFADEERIQQVLTNLIVNSLKYGVKNGKTLVSLEELNEEKVLVKISDNGEGIAEEHLPRLFERFYRVDKSGNRKAGGSGLGLSIVKHIIEAHQEKLLVESTPGSGSEFSFTLQRATKEVKSTQD